jgi:hypothetical protein
MNRLIFKGKPVADDSSRVCVLFDSKTGRIAHIHGVTSLDGRKKATDAEVERSARAHATHFGHSVGGLKALHTSLAAIRQGGPLKVNSEGTAGESERHPRMPASAFLAKRHQQQARRK